MKTLTLLFCSCLLAAALQAQIIHVPADYSTIQLGINAATPSDTVLVAEGTYYEQINFKGKKPLMVASRFIVDGDTSHISKTIIDGSQLTNKDSASVVYFSSGEDTTSILSGFKITGGRGTITDNTGFGHSRVGGGICISSSGATIRNNQVSGNRCENLTVSGLGVVGGGIASAWEQEENWIIIENNIIDNNIATTKQPDGWSQGGGISIGNNCRIIGNIIRNNVVKGLVVSSDWAQGAGASVVAGDPLLNKLAIIRNNLFKDNSVNSNLAYTGGLLVGNMLLSCSGNTFIGNRAESDLNITTVGAGGMAANSCIEGTVISGNIFKQNYSEGFGGGLEIESFDVIPKNILVENNYFFNNIAKDWGGAFHDPNCPVKLQNNVFSGNHSENKGGAISLTSGVASSSHLITLINNSFSRNTASYGGAIASTNSKPLIINSVFWGDSAGYGREIYLFGNDKVEIANSIINKSYITGTLTDGGSILNQDPLFTDSVLLTTKSCSPCIDAGIVSYTCSHNETIFAPALDKTGIPRPLESKYDIGAYELEFSGDGIPEIQTNMPYAAWPNPFTSYISFNYTLDNPSKVILSVFNNFGLVVAEPVNEFQQHGEQKVNWNAEGLPAGIYYCRLLAGEQIRSVKIIKVK
jgi:hypothetical protein